MKTVCHDTFTAFSAAITSVAEAIRENPENRKMYNPIVLAIADSLIEFEDLSRSERAADD